MALEIQSIEIMHVQMPLKFEFKTAKTLLTNRDTIIIIVEGKSGYVGYGEVVAFTEPFYTTETLTSALQILKSQYIPKILKETINHPFDIHCFFDLSSPMALAGLENALLDLYAKEREQNIIEMLFQEQLNEHIEVGIALGDMPIDALLNRVALHVEQGCKRIKFKIFPSESFTSFKKLQKVRQAFPKLIMLADANASFVFNSHKCDELELYNELNLACIEEGFYIDNKPIHEYDDKTFKMYNDKIKKLNFKLCHDESLLSVQDMMKAYENDILQMINIKIGRLGGLYYTSKIINFCREKNIPFFIGSMLESGISKILHVQLAALPWSCMAGDLSDSARYFEQDIIQPCIVSKHGKIAVPSGAGIGVLVDKAILKKYTVQSWHFS